MTVLAAIDDSAAARPVLDFAGRAATLLDTNVEAVHVQEDGSGEHAAAAAAAAQIPLRVLHGDIVGALESEVLASDALALVIGTRAGPAGAEPAGHVALDVVQSLGCTVVVVPPDTEDRPLRRVLVAVEGDGVSPGLRRLVEHIGERPTPELIALHVIEPADVPPFADSPVLEAEAFEREFRIRVAGTLFADPSFVRFEMRVGDPAEALREATQELDADLVMLVWHGKLSARHGRLVREMLTNGRVPVALYARPL